MCVGFMCVMCVNSTLWASRAYWEYEVVIHVFMQNLAIWMKLYSRHYAHGKMFIPFIIPFDFYQ